MKTNAVSSLLSSPSHVSDHARFRPYAPPLSGREISCSDPGSRTRAQLEPQAVPPAATGLKEVKLLRSPERAMVKAGETTLAKRFLLGEEVGRGGLSVVRRALDLATGEPVAVKIAQDGRGERRFFRREAHALAQLQRSTIVRFVAEGADNAGRPFLVMELLRGEDLRARLRRRSMDLAEVIALARRLCDALSAVHGGGFLHRDVKPGNVFLPECCPSQAKLIDFGLACDGRSLGGPGSEPPQPRPEPDFTETGAFTGTPGFVAPEQARGERHRSGPRADIFSLGCVLYNCLAGRAPYPGNTAAARLVRLMDGPPPPLSGTRRGVPVPLDALVQRMLCHDPAGRPGSISEVAEVLDLMA